MVDTILNEPYEILIRFEFDQETRSSRVAGCHFKARTIGLAGDEVKINVEGQAQNPALLSPDMRAVFDSAMGGNASYLAQIGKLQTEIAALIVAKDEALRLAAEKAAVKEADDQMIAHLSHELNIGLTVFEKTNEAMLALIAVLEAEQHSPAVEAEAIKLTISALAAFVTLGTAQPAEAEVAT